MTEGQFRSSVIFMLSAAVFCLAVATSPAAAVLTSAWVQWVVDALLYVAAIGMAAGAALFAMATAGSRE